MRRDYRPLWELPPPQPPRVPWALVIWFAGVVLGVLLFALGVV